MVSRSESTGGAAIAESRLARGLNREGTRARRLVALAKKDAHAPRRLRRADWDLREVGPTGLSALHYRRDPHRGLLRWAPPGVKRLYDQSPAVGWLRAFSRSRVRRQWLQLLDEALAEAPPDIINVHNMHGIPWDFEAISVCLRHAPVVWTLHDMWAFTGSCAYSFECRRFEGRCDSTCPQTAAYPTALAPEIASLHRKRLTLFGSKPALTLVAPSRWLAEQAKIGVRGAVPVEHIPYGLPVKELRPGDRSEARRSLGLDPQGIVLCSMAATLDDPRKGMSLLVEALSMLDRTLTCVLVGKGRLPALPEQLKVMAIPWVETAEEFSRIFSAADLFVFPSLADNLPCSLQEALCCGLPCVGFSVGGVPDLIRPGITGWLAQETSSKALGAAIDAALSEPDQLERLRLSARQVAVSEYGLNLQAQRYLSLFEQLLRGE